MPLPADFEKRLWAAADQLWTNSALQPSEYSTPVLALIFLKYADTRFAQAEARLARKTRRRGAVGKEDYHAEGVVFVPEAARFQRLLKLPEGSDIGKALNEAMKAIEGDNDELKDVLPKTYGRFDAQTLKELLKIFGTIPEDVEGDVFGRIYEYFLGAFAPLTLQKGGEYFTPYSVVRLIVEIVEPYHGRIYDPCCGSGGMFVQSANLIAAHEKKASDEISVYGVEKIAQTLRLAKMNLAAHGLSGDIKEANAYYEDVHNQVGRFDFVMANPPFNQNAVDKDRIRDDKKRFPFGMPDADNANYLWVQLFYSALSEKGRAGFVMTNSASDVRGSQLELRKMLIRSGAVDVMVTIGPNFFYTVTLPATLWFLDKGKDKGARKDKVLFIDARHIFRQVDRSHRDFSTEQLEFLANVVRLYRGGKPDTTQGSEGLLKESFPNGKYADVAGFCKAATTTDIEAQGWSLNPGRYVGTAAPTAMRLRGMQLYNIHGFKDLNVRFPDGSVAVLVGANGAGKSTVLDSIAKFISPFCLLLQGASPQKAPYSFTKNDIHAGEKLAEATMAITIDGADQSWRIATDQSLGKPSASAGMTPWIKSLRTTLDVIHRRFETDEATSIPVFCYYPATRPYIHGEVPKKRAKGHISSPPQFGAYENAFDMGQESFESIVGWFRREEDLENEARLGERPDYISPRLDEVRQAVLRFMDKLSGGRQGIFQDLRVKRDSEDMTKAQLVLRKEDTKLPLNTLSDGERGSILLVADLAQRLITANPGAPDPLSGTGIVLIDEIELHLHPSWQRTILPALLATFRGCQFIVTTHSPQVLSCVRRDQILLFSRFKRVEHLPFTEGRDTNAILDELMGVSIRPKDALAQIDELARLIDNEDLVEARRRHAALELHFGPDDHDLLRLGAMLHALEQGDEP